MFFLKFSTNFCDDTHLFVTWEHTMAVLFKLGYQCKFCGSRDCFVVVISLKSRVLFGIVLSKWLLSQREGEEKGVEERKREGGRKKYRQKQSLCATHKIPNISLFQLIQVTNASLPLEFNFALVCPFYKSILRYPVIDCPLHSESTQSRVNPASLDPPTNHPTIVQILLGAF